MVRRCTLEPSVLLPLMHIVQAVPSMMTLRYDLVPRELSENQFWNTYFSLMREEFGEVRVVSLEGEGHYISSLFFFDANQQVDVAADIVREETGARPVDYSSLLDIDQYRATRTAMLRNEERTLSGPTLPSPPRLLELDQLGRL